VLVNHKGGIEMKIKGYRVMAGYSQKDMASLINIGTVSYSLKETGKRQFNQVELEKIFKVLKEKLPNLEFENLFTIN
jgi:DNA-binding XRE family transcriptional regulator